MKHSLRRSQRYRGDYNTWSHRNLAEPKRYNEGMEPYRIFKIFPLRLTKSETLRWWRNGNHSEIFGY